LSYPALAVVMLVLAVLMVSSVKFRSFKDLKVNAFSITLMLVVIAVSGFLWIRYSPAYILMGILLIYVGLGFGEAIIFWPRRRREKRDPDREIMR